MQNLYTFLLKPIYLFTQTYIPLDTAVRFIAKASGIVLSVAFLKACYHGFAFGAVRG